MFFLVNESQAGEADKQCQFKCAAWSPSLINRLILVPHPWGLSALIDLGR